VIDKNGGIKLKLSSEYGCAEVRTSLVGKCLYIACNPFYFSLFLLSEPEMSFGLFGGSTSLEAARLVSLGATSRPDKLCEVAGVGL
jgi:hypothetical protein